MIDSFHFGAMVINGCKYSSDLMIYPDGRVQDTWWRNRGHVLILADIQTLLDSVPEVMIIGKGIHGRMKPEPDIEEVLGKIGIQFMAGPNAQAVTWFNERLSISKVGACFHLTC